MIRIIILAGIVLAIITALSAIAGYIYTSGKQSERTSQANRAAGMKIEREVLNAKVKNVTVEQRCKRNSIDFVLDDTGGHCE